MTVSVTIMRGCLDMEALEEEEAGGVVERDEMGRGQTHISIEYELF